MTEQAPKNPKKLPKGLGLGLVVAVAAVAIATGAWLYNGGPATASQCPVRPDVAAAIDEAAQGELAALNATAEGRGYADLAFIDKDGKAKTIADFKGKTLLINFWASWCVPCREEMPALNALAAKYNDQSFEVLPINLDIGDSGLDKARQFLAEGQWPNLPLYADPTFKAFDRLKTEAVAVGLPASILVDAEGCEVGVLQGPAHWDTPDGGRVVEALKGIAKI
jgi:thiol-disulfide isomerase/thioredoxin